MLGQKKEHKGITTTYLNIKDGAIEKRTAEGTEQYSYVEGRLISLRKVDRAFNGQVVPYWYIELQDEETGESYSLGFFYGSNVYKSIILQLASEDGIAAVKAASTIRIAPYKKDGYDKVQVYGEGVGLSWATQKLPPITEIMIGGRKVKDDTKRMGLICSLSEIIKKAIPQI